MRDRGVWLITVESFLTRRELAIGIVAGRHAQDDALEPVALVEHHRDSSHRPCLELFDTAERRVARRGLRADLGQHLTCARVGDIGGEGEAVALTIEAPGHHCSRSGTDDLHHAGFGQPARDQV